MGRGEMQEAFRKRARDAYEAKEQAIGVEAMVFHQRMIMLQIVDSQWKDHLYALDHLKEGIGLRGYGQRDPLIEYKKESFLMYQALTDRIDEEILRWVYLYEPVRHEAGPDDEGQEPVPAPHPRTSGGAPRRPAEGAVDKPRPLRQTEPPLISPRAMPRNLTFNDPSAVLSGSGSTAARFGGGGGGGESAEPREAQGGADAAVQTIRREGPKVGRNDPCPCGSGKKYKKCHGVNA
jgi:preprotein translocase subunit SecA